MNREDIRTFARATQRVMDAVEDGGKIPTIEMLEVIETATRNPLLGFGMACGLAARAGVNYLNLGLGDILGNVDDTDASDLDEAQQAEYRIEYVMAVNEAKRLSEYTPAADVARMLHVTPLRVRQMINEEKLDGEKRGGRWWVSNESFDALVEARGLDDDWLHGSDPQYVGFGGFGLSHGKFTLNLVNAKGDREQIEIYEDSGRWRVSCPKFGFTEGVRYAEAQDAANDVLEAAAEDGYRVPAE